LLVAFLLYFSLAYQRTPTEAIASGTTPTTWGAIITCSIGVAIRLPLIAQPVIIAFASRCGSIRFSDSTYKGINVFFLGLLLLSLFFFSIPFLLGDAFSFSLCFFGCLVGLSLGFLLLLYLDALLVVTGQDLLHGCLFHSLLLWLHFLYLLHGFAYH